MGRAFVRKKCLLVSDGTKSETMRADVVNPLSTLGCLSPTRRITGRLRRAGKPFGLNPRLQLSL